MPLALRIVFIVLGSGAVAASAWLRAMNTRAQNWPSTRGRILRSALRSDPHDAGSRVEVEYEFSVQGRKYKSSNLAYAAMPDDAGSKERLVAQYPVGAEVDVFHDAKDPKTSVLLRPRSSSWYWLAATGAAFVLIGVAVP
jgi:Protein of unknown function (DUF3592)